MRRVHQIAGAAFLLIAAFLGYQATGLRYFTSLGPGPGFFPVWLCLLLGLLALALIVQVRLAPAEPLPDDFFAERAGYLRIAAVLAALLVLPFLMPILGFRVTMLGFYLALLSLLGRRHPVETVVLALIGSFGTHYLFTQLLSQPLPAGSLGL